MLLLPEGEGASVLELVKVTSLDAVVAPERLKRPVGVKEPPLGVALCKGDMVNKREGVRRGDGVALGQRLEEGVAQGEGVAARRGLRVAWGAEGLARVLKLGQRVARVLRLPLLEAEAQDVGLRVPRGEAEALELLEGEPEAEREARWEREMRGVALRLGETLALSEAREALEETVGSVVGMAVPADVEEGLPETLGVPLPAPAGLALDKGPLEDGVGEVVVQGVGERVARKWEGLAVGEAPSDAVGRGGVAVTLPRLVAVVKEVEEMSALAVRGAEAEVHSEVMGEGEPLLLAEEQDEGLPVKSELELKEALLVLQAVEGNEGEGVVLAQGEALGVGEEEGEGVRAPDKLALALPPLELGVDAALPEAIKVLLPLLLLQALPLPWLLPLPLALLRAVVEPVGLSVPAPALEVWLLQLLTLWVREAEGQAVRGALREAEPDAVPTAGEGVALVVPLRAPLPLRSNAVEEIVGVALLPAARLGLATAVGEATLLKEVLGEPLGLRVDRVLLLAGGEAEVDDEAAELELENSTGVLEG